ncbi:hypothetical protein EW026_g5775 [Hermanssonia centrifuga]|uniref:nitric oxide dioxygenase n=1 Tax=Hermanssonia centrifuga TaxID=98765 RepID=A0A4S4KHG7_9APHY|nr:hypothetical protein EW026_g5775 [Hermanssonia centrifuga]
MTEASAATKSNTCKSENLPSPGPLTEAQRKLVKATVPVLEAHGQEITSRFYKEMLEANPELGNVFNYSKQQKGDQADALARAVYAYAANIDDITPLRPVIERVCNKHTSLHITPSQYAIVGKHLLQAIAEVVGTNVFSGDLYEAWVVAYWQLAHLFIDREAELYKQAGWVGWKDFVVSRKVIETDDITSFYLSPKDETPLPPFRPGQYISVQKFVKELGLHQSRQYSLSDSPNPNHFRISVKRERGIRAVDPSTGAVDLAQNTQLGLISNLLHDTLIEGDGIEVAFPYGDFFLDDSTAPVVLISAGVGLTPLTSMLHAVLEGPTPRQVSWIQVVRSLSSHPLNAEVRRLLESKPSLVRRAIFYSDPGVAVGEDCDFKGRLNISLVPTETLRLDDPMVEYYVCGPEAFMADVIKGLKLRGVSINRIHAEVFGAGAVPLD